MGRRHPGVSHAGSTPADLLSASPGQSNLFLPVVPGPRRTPQTPTGEGGQGAGPASPRGANAPAHCPAPGSPQTPPTAGTLQLSREGLSSRCSSARPRAKAVWAESRGGAPHPAPCRGPPCPTAPGEPVPSQGTRGSSRRASCNLSLAASAPPAPGPPQAPPGTSSQHQAMPALPGHGVP